MLYNDEGIKNVKQCDDWLDILKLGVSHHSYKYGFEIDEIVIIDQHIPIVMHQQGHTIKPNFLTNNDNIWSIAKGFSKKVHPIEKVKDGKEEKNEEEEEEQEKKNEEEQEDNFGTPTFAKRKILQNIRKKMKNNHNEIGEQEIETMDERLQYQPKQNVETDEKMCYDLKIDREKKSKSEQKEQEKKSKLEQLMASIYNHKPNK